VRKPGGSSTPEQPDNMLNALITKCIECYSLSVYKYIYPKVDNQEKISADLTSEVFHRFFLSLSNMSPEERTERACANYLLSIARWVILEYRQSKGSMMYRQHELATIPLSTPRYDLSNDPNIADSQAENELQERLNDEEDQLNSNRGFFQLIDMLPNEHQLEREILVFRYFYDMVPEVIETILNIPARMIRKREKTALELLRKVLKPAVSVKERG
jgi:RNA polymerase sigma factor (sigma-70 family)